MPATKKEAPAKGENNRLLMDENLALCCSCVDKTEVVGGWCVYGSQIIAGSQKHFG